MATRRLAKVDGELIAALSALVLGALMFLAQWYGNAGVPGTFAPRSGSSRPENAWHALTTLRWLMLAAIVTALALLALRLLGRGPRVRANLALMVAALAALTSVLLIYRVLLAPPSPAHVVDQKLGALAGLLAALGIALGGYQASHETRTSARRVVQGSRT